MATTNNLFGDASAAVVVYGPDGKAYGSPAAARAAGVTNYTMSPPTSIKPNPSIPLFDSNGNRIYQKENWNQEDPPPPGQGWVYNPGRGGSYTREIGAFEDTLPQQLAAKYNLPLSQITPILKEVGNGKSGQQTIGYYSHYDPATNIVTNFDPNGNLLEQGQKNAGMNLGIFNELLSGISEIGKPINELQKQGLLVPLMLAAGTGGFGLFNGIDMAVPAALAGGEAAGTAGSVLAPGSYSLGGGLAGSTAPLLGASGSAGAAFTAAELAAAQATLGAGTLGGAGLFSAAAPSVLAPGSYSLAGAGGALGTAGASIAGGNLLSTLGSAASNLLPSSSTLSSLGGAASSILPSLITGGLQGLGAVNTAEKAREAAQIQADAQIKAAQIAADAAKFRPVGVTTRFGSSNFTTDAQGNVIGAGYTASPELKAYQDRLSALAKAGLTGAEGAAAAYAPLTTGAQSLFNLGQSYIKQTPEQQAADYIAKQQALLAPGQEQQLAQLQARLLAQGRGGLSVAQGGNLSATSPELAAYYNALAQSNLQLAAQGQQAGMEQAKFGAGLLGTGSDLMGKYYAGQTAAYSPFATAIDTSSGLENLAQQPLTLGMNIGGVTSAASANAGKLLSQGMINSAATQAPANAFSYSGDLFSQVANNPQLQDYLRRAFAT